MDIGQLIATLGVDTSSLIEAEKEFAEFEKKINQRTKEINKSLERVGNSMKSIGKTMTKTITLPMTIAGGAALKMQKDFEASMTRITSLVGVAQSQVNAWRQDVLKLGESLGKDPRELADALFFVTSAGIRGAEALEVLEASAKASAIGLGETKTVADLVTSAVNAYGIQNLKASKATDILVTAVKEGKAEADALAQSMGQVLPIASEMGVTFDQVGAAIAAMTRTGTDAATASIQLRQILASMLKPSKQAEEALGDMSTSSKELRDIIAQQGLIAALQKLKTLTSIYGKEVMGQVFPNIRALSGVLDLMGKNAKDNIAIFESLKNTTGALDKGFEVTAETAEFKYNKALAASKVALIDLGAELQEVVIPLIEKLTIVIQKITRWFGNLTESQKRLVLIIGGVSAALGPLLTVFGFFISSILPKAITGISALIKMFRLLKIAMISNPITAVVVGITALTAAIFAFSNKTKGAADAQDDLNESLLATEQIANRKKIEQFLRNAGILVTVLKEIAPGISIETEQIDNSVESIEKLRKAVKNLSVNELSGLADILKSQIVEIKRGLEGVDLTGVLFGDLAKRRGELFTLQNTLRAITEELEKASKIDPFAGIAGGGTTISRSGKAGAIAPRPLGLLPTKATVDPFPDDSLRKLKEYNKVIADLNEELRIVNKMNEVLGGTFDANAMKTDILLQSLEELIANGLDPNSSAIQGIISELENLERQQNRTFKGMVKNINEVAQIVGGALMNVLSELGNNLEAQKQQQLRNVEDLAKRTGMTEEELDKKRQEINERFAKRQKRLAIIQSIINTAVAVTNALATIPPPLNFVVAGLAGAAGGVQIATIRRQQLAEGGIVPSGYPNDSYPALLTSGETVVPAKKLPDFQGKNNLDYEQFRKTSSENTKDIVRAINNRPEQKLTPVGLVTTTNAANDKTNYIDTRYRI